MGTRHHGRPDGDPVRVAEILLGKLLPYFVLGMGGMALSALMAVLLFGVPLRGSLVVLLAFRPFSC